MIRNAITYLIGDWTPKLDLVWRREYAAIGALDHESHGFVAPIAGSLICEVGPMRVMCLQSGAKILPASVVNQVASERAAKLAESQGFKVGRRQMREIKEQVVIDLLPRALVRLSRTLLWIDTERKTISVDTSSESVAERVLEILRDTDDTFAPQRIDTNTSATGAMTGWLAESEAPCRLSIGRTAELVTVDEDMSSVTYRKHAIDDEDTIKEHIAHGKRVRKLELTHDDALSFVLNWNGYMSRIHPTDAALEKLSVEAEDAHSEFCSRFLLIATEVGRATDAVIEACNGLRAKD